jgi:hypothetical protein
MWRTTAGCATEVFCGAFLPGAPHKLKKILWHREMRHIIQISVA